MPRTQRRAGVKCGCHICFAGSLALRHDADTQSGAQLWRMNSNTNVFLNHSSKDKTVVRETCSAIEEGRHSRGWMRSKSRRATHPRRLRTAEASRVLVLWHVVNAFGSDWAQWRRARSVSRPAEQGAPLHPSLANRKELASAQSSDIIQY